jgi:hypothetical protein
LIDTLRNVTEGKVKTTITWNKSAHLWAPNAKVTELTNVFRKTTFCRIWDQSDTLARDSYYSLHLAILIYGCVSFQL